MTYNKLVLLHEYISNETQLISSFKDDSKIIQTNNETKLEDILGQIQEFKSDDGTYPFNHLTFVYHFPGYHSVPFLETVKEDLCGNLLDNKYHYFNDEIIDLIKELGNELTVDLLSCDLKDDNFKEEVAKIESDLNINIRYSVDQTGNNPQGNWVLESDSVDVKDLYFSETIDQWNGVLTNGRTISQIRGITGYDTYFTIDGNTIKLNGNFTWSNITSNLGWNINDYVTLGNGQSFDGQGYTIDLTGITLFEGLFASSATSLPDGSTIDVSNYNDETKYIGCPTIKNLGILNGTLLNFRGYLIRQSQHYFVVDNCYSTGVIIQSSGGICSNGSKRFLAKNCYSTGNITKQDSGGICGGGCYLCMIKNCYSTGNISANNCGGICASFCNTNFIIDCYSSGIIQGQYAGGICGKNSGSYNGITTINNCFSTGAITGDNAGGIAGSEAGVNNPNDSNQRSGKIYINNCYSTGTIDSNASNAGGITGSRCAINYGKCYINNCYSINDVRAILGTSANYAVGAITVTNSYGESGGIGNDNTKKQNGNYPLSNINQHKGIGELEQEYMISFTDNYEYPILKSNTGIGINGIIYYDNDNNTISLKQSVSLDDLKSDFIHNSSDFTHFILGDEQVFDGQGNTIDLSTNITAGLFASTGSSIDTAPLIKNLGVLGGSLNDFCGYIVKREQNYFIVDNCYSTGNIIANGSGGITGNQFGVNGHCIISNCYTTGNINGKYSGGICAIRPGQNGICYINNSYTTGNINGQYSGGIVGASCAASGRCNISNCYSTGNITNSECGGICATEAGRNGGTCNINNCYYTGTINGTNSGGMCGSDVGLESGTCNINNCYSINGSIIGSIDTTGTVTVTNCYSPSGSTGDPLHGNYPLTNISNHSGIGNLGNEYIVSFLNNYEYPLLRSNLGAGLITYTNHNIILNKTVEFSILQNALNHNTTDFTHFIPNNSKQHIKYNGNYLILSNSHSNNTDILNNTEILNVGNLKESSYNDNDIFKSNFEVFQLKPYYNATTMKSNNYTATQLKKGPYSAKELKVAGFTINELKHAGYKTHEIYKAGYPANQLFISYGTNMRVLSIMRANNYSVADIHNGRGRVTITEQDYLAAGYPQSQIDEL
jgi:hypothetical protein